MTRLDDIKARAAAATPGPWRVSSDGHIDGKEPSGGFVTPCIADSPMNHAHDATFIAHSRDDIDWLIALVEELSAALDRAYSVLQMMRVGYRLDERDASALADRADEAEAALRNLEAE